MNGLIGYKRNISDSCPLIFEGHKKRKDNPETYGKILNLPPEMILKILGYCSLNGLKKIALTSKRLGYLSLETKLLANKLAKVALKEYFAVLLNRHFTEENFEEEILPRYFQVDRYQLAIYSKSPKVIDRLNRTLWKRLKPSKIGGSQMKWIVNHPFFLDVICEKQSIKSAKLNISGELSLDVLDKIRSLNKLKELSLTRCEMKTEVIHSVCHITNLEILSIAHCQISDIEALQFEGLTHLHSLTLIATRLKEAFTEHIKMLTGLINLNLESNTITQSGLEQLTSLTNLNLLNLNRNLIDDAGAKILRVFPNLRELHLQMNMIGNAGLEHLTLHTALRVLDLGRNEINDGGGTTSYNFTRSPSAQTTTLLL